MGQDLWSIRPTMYAPKKTRTMSATRAGSGPGQKSTYSEQISSTVNSKCGLPNPTPTCCLRHHKFLYTHIHIYTNYNYSMLCLVIANFFFFLFCNACRMSCKCKHSIYYNYGIVFLWVHCLRSTSQVWGILDIAYKWYIIHAQLKDKLFSIK